MCLISNKGVDLSKSSVHILDRTIQFIEEKLVIERTFFSSLNLKHIF